MPLPAAVEESWHRVVSPEPPHEGYVILGVLLLPLAWLYRLATLIKRGFFWRVPGARTQVDAVVVSVGNLTVGGTGKTPLAARVGRHFSRELAVPTTLLTRGYGADARAPVTLVGQGGHLLVPAREAGDEACVLTRACPEATVVVSKRRALGARHAVRELGARVVILDDGLQYWRLHRDLDLVTIDADDPFGNMRLFPAGRLREPPAALARADALVLRSRARLTAVPEVLRRYAPRTPAYQARYHPLAWRRARDGARRELHELRGRVATAACGLGDPVPFFDLADEILGAELTRVRFPDHHRYTADELLALDGPIVMTEKDGANLPEEGALPEVWLLEVDLKLQPLEGAPPLEQVLDAALY